MPGDGGLSGESVESQCTGAGLRLLLGIQLARAGEYLIVTLIDPCLYSCALHLQHVVKHAPVTAAVRPAFM
jgi:predicted metal-binding membrane protein